MRPISLGAGHPASHQQSPRWRDRQPDTTGLHMNFAMCA